MPQKNVVITGVMTWEEAAPGVPTHPIVIPPGSISDGVPTHPIVLPPPVPGHPIVIPPDAISPGVPAHPIVLPPYYPAHPIIIPPDSISDGVPSHPIYLPPGIWGGGNVPMPTPPIHLPPDSSGYPPSVTPPAANVPVHGSMVWLEGKGYVFIPDSVAEQLKPPYPAHLPAEKK